MTPLQALCFAPPEIHQHAVQWQLCVPYTHSLDRCGGNSDELDGKSRNSPAEDIEKDENLRYTRLSGFFLMVVFFIIIITRRVFEENKLWLTYFLAGFSSLCAAWNWDYNGAINTAKEHNWNCLNSTKPVFKDDEAWQIKRKLPMILAKSKVIYFVFHYQNFHDTESKKTAINIK